MIEVIKFKKNLVNSIVRKLNGVSDYKCIADFQRSLIFKYYETFRYKSTEVLGKNVKYKSNLLFHLLRFIGLDPDPEDFLLNERVSNNRTETEIETVFKSIGWEYRQM